MNQLGRPRAKTEEKAPLCLQAYAYDPNPQVITRTVTEQILCKQPCKAPGPRPREMSLSVGALIRSCCHFAHW